MSNIIGGRKHMDLLYELISSYEKGWGTMPQLLVVNILD